MRLFTLFFVFICFSNPGFTKNSSLSEDLDSYAEILGSALRCDLDASEVGKTISNWVEEVSEEDYKNFVRKMLKHKNGVQPTGLKNDCNSVKERLINIEILFKEPYQQSIEEVSSWLSIYANKDPVKGNVIRHYAAALDIAGFCELNIENELIKVVNYIDTHTMAKVSKQDVFNDLQNLMLLIQNLSFKKASKAETCTPELEPVFRKIAWPDSTVSAEDSIYFKQQNSAAEFIFSRYQDLSDFYDTLQ